MLAPDTYARIAEEIRRLGETALATLGADFEYAGPASEADLQNVERLLNVTLPTSYRAFLLTFGAAMLCLYNIYGIADKESHWVRPAPTIVDFRYAPKQQGISPHE